MRPPTALDALARWLVLTLAGVGLFAMVPGSPAAPRLASPTWLMTLNPIHFLAIVMVLLAWGLFVVHIVRRAGVWRTDRIGVTLVVASLLALGACLTAFTVGTDLSTFSALLVAVTLHIALCVRLDALSRKAHAGVLPDVGYLTGSR